MFRLQYWRIVGLDTLAQIVSMNVAILVYIYLRRAQFQINGHSCWNWHLCISDGLSVVQCILGHAIGNVFWHNFGGMKRMSYTCLKRTRWTTAWWCCPSLDIPSSIPAAGSMILYRFFCGFRCVFLCQSIKITPTNTYVYIDGLIQTMVTLVNWQ